MEKAELACLVRCAQRGDARAFDALVRRFQNPAVFYARSLLRFDGVAAEDAAQEAFVQAWRDLPMLKSPLAFPTWLRRLVFKQCDRVRRRGSLCLIPLEAAFYVADGRPEPFATTAANADSVRLWQAFESLPERERLSALLYYRDDHNLAEIAAFLGIPQTTVKNRLYAARQRLRKELWEMAEVILEREKPSRNEAFAGSVVARVLAEFRQQMQTDPHTANRALLAEGRQALDAALAVSGPLPWETVRAGLLLLLDQDDRKAIGPLMMRYLAQPLDDSHTVWAYYHLSNGLACSGDPVGAILAHEALERRLLQMNARLSRDWPYDPLPPDADSSVVVAGQDLNLFALHKSGEFADAYYAVWRGGEYLDKVDAALAQSVPSDDNRPWRFYCLRMAFSRSAAHGEIERARGYVAQMYALADEPQPASSSDHWRAKAMGHDMDLRHDMDDTAVVTHLAHARIALLAGAQGEWVHPERHNLAHSLMFTGNQDLALPLFEQNLAEGGQQNGWGYLLHAAAVYHLTNDRARALTLLRDAAVREASDLTEDFRKRPEFADVKDNPEFLAAIHRLK